MKILKSTLKKLIKEELAKSLVKEAKFDDLSSQTEWYDLLPLLTAKIQSTFEQHSDHFVLEIESGYMGEPVSQEVVDLSMSSSLITKKIIKHISSIMRKMSGKKDKSGYVDIVMYADYDVFLQVNLPLDHNDNWLGTISYPNSEKHYSSSFKEFVDNIDENLLTAWLDVTKS